VLGIPDVRDIGDAWVLGGRTAYFRPDGTYLTTTTADGRFPAGGAAWATTVEVSGTSIWTGLDATSQADGAQNCAGFTSTAGTGLRASTQAKGTPAYSQMIVACTSNLALLCVASP
jgi:hypothetical protein